MHRWQKAWLGVLATAAILVAACGGSSSGSSASLPNGNVFRYAAPGEPDSLDPGGGISGFDQYFQNAIFDTLIVTDPKTMQPNQPGLATSWEFVGSDKLTFRLHLRKGVKFQDGTPMDAAAVKTSLEHYKSLGQWRDLTQVQSINAVDSNTVDLKLSSQYSQLPGALAFRAGMIVSPTALQKYGKDFGRHPVGAGPFAFKSWDPGSKISLTKFNGYWNKNAIHFNGIDYKIITNAPSMVNAILGKQIDFAQLLNLPAPDMTALKGNPDVESRINTTLSVGIVTTNDRIAPFNNEQVRQALNMSIDRQKLVEAMLGKGVGQGAASQYVPPNYWAYSKDLKAFPYDPGKAKQMLAQAGYPNGISPQICTFSDDTTKAATIEKQQMAPAGVNLQIVQQPVNSCVGQLQSGGIPMVQIGWFFLASAYQGYATMFGPGNPYGDFQGVNPLLAQVNSTYTQQEQAPLYHQLNQVLAQRAPSIPTYYLVNPVAWSKRVNGLVTDINGVVRFNQANFTSGT
ncbi:MAG: hypothetical protein J2P43_11840 [Candidatus Dormibacteraeota bacterium]|nr:hypothetical protein [Candidatus Dormibacteraeota bacterium]